MKHPIDITCPTCNAAEELLCSFSAANSDAEPITIGIVSGLVFHTSRVEAARDAGAICDGDHAAPPCSSAYCWRKDMVDLGDELTRTRRELAEALADNKRLRELSDLQHRTLERAMKRIKISVARVQETLDKEAQP